MQETYHRQRFDERIERLLHAIQNLVGLKKRDLDAVGLKPYFVQNIAEKNKIRLMNLSHRLEAVSIEQVLKRGFAWVSDRHFKTIYDASAANRAGELNVRFADGIVKTKIAEVRDARQFDLFDE